MKGSHDPQIKNAVSKIILHFLYDKFFKKQKAKIVSMIDTNCKLQRTGTRAFCFRGITYDKYDNAIRVSRVQTKLDPSLLQEMENYLRDMHEVEDLEMPYVKGFITTVLNSSEHFPDYLRLFPSILHGPLEKLNRSWYHDDKRLTDFEVNTLIQKNSKAIALLKERVVRNLLI